MDQVDQRIVIARSDRSIDRPGVRVM